MALEVETFSNRPWPAAKSFGGSVLFKALGHPLVAPEARALMNRLGREGPVAVYDPLAHAATVDAFYGLSGLDIAGVYVQRLHELDQVVLGRAVRPLTALKESGAKAVFVASFDAAGLIDQARRFLPDGAQVASLDEMRLPDDWLSNRRDYLSALNFATNFAFLRDHDGHHTRITLTNYWGGYGAKDPELWFRLFDDGGSVLAEWRQELPGPGASFAIDSREVRARFGLGPFTGSLFMHAIRVAGHDVVKYLIDTYGDTGEVLSCTHDANAWPAELYAGLPAPDRGEKVILWIQNSHPLAIPPGAVGLNLMGSEDVAWLDHEIPAFGTHALDVSELLPDAAWPQQLEVRAGKHFVRPRYEVIRESGRSRIAHANVERTDLVPDPYIPELEKLMGKGYIMPLPVLPLDEFRSVALPTPMATSQRELPLSVVLLDGSGAEAARRYLGRVPRGASVAIDVDRWLAEEGLELASGYGHLELIYDFREGGEADGWLHAIGRYAQRKSGHEAETSFGAHIFNTLLVYRDEPQSYASRPPGLTTRLFLRLGQGGLETFSHLIYPASTPWHETSSTKLVLNDGGGAEMAEVEVRIPCGGSLHWRYSEMFDAETRAGAGEGAYITVRDTTCRLFGYQGLINGETAFSLDHMFGF